MNKRSLKMAEKKNKADKENLNSFNLEFKQRSSAIINYADKMGIELEFENSDKHNAKMLVSEFTDRMPLEIEEEIRRNDWD